MDATIRQSSPPLPDAETELLLDRRRPGRAEVDPALVPLLRKGSHADFTEFETASSAHEAAPDATMNRDDEGNAIKGLLFGLMLSLPFWLVAAFVGVMILR